MSSSAIRSLSDYPSYDAPPKAKTRGRPPPGRFQGHRHSEETRARLRQVSAERSARNLELYGTRLPPAMRESLHNAAQRRRGLAKLDDKRLMKWTKPMLVTFLADFVAHAPMTVTARKLGVDRLTIKKQLKRMGLQRDKRISRAERMALVREMALREGPLGTGALTHIFEQCKIPNDEGDGR